MMTFHDCVHAARKGEIKFTEKFTPSINNYCLMGNQYFYHGEKLRNC